MTHFPCGVNVPAAAKAVGPRMQASEAIPFLEKPPKLDGSLAGDVGFDPMGFSNSYDMNWLRVGSARSCIYSRIRANPSACNDGVLCVRLCARANSEDGLSGGQGEDINLWKHSRHHGTSHTNIASIRLCILEGT